MKALIIASDGLDIDVYKNIKYFYEACGYNIHLKNSNSINYDLIIYLRGEILDSFVDFNGIVHVFDYVKNISIDWDYQFPNSNKIYLVTLELPKTSCIKNNIKYVNGFLPIIPKLWVRISKKKNFIPLHISHFKKDINNSYQDELIALADSKEIVVYGKRWTLKNVIVKSISLSESNKKFRDSLYSFGLMYDYQIGKTLSGRMWQAPLSGCYVFTELASNILNCPGVIEVESYKNTVKKIKTKNFEKINIPEVILFWNKHTNELADKLNLNFVEKSKLGRLFFEIKFNFFIFKLNLRDILFKR